MNLVTSCRSCNRGKSDRRLDDDTVVEKRRRQLETLQERREQIEMMMQWQRSLADLESTEVDQVAEFLSDLLDGHYGLNQNGRRQVSQLLNDFSLQETLEAIRIAVNQYARYDDSGRPTEESVETIISKLGGICYNRRRWNKDPDQETLDKAYWSFLKTYRANCSHHPERWELKQWWNDHIAPMIRAADLVQNAENVGKRIVRLAELEYLEGNYTSYASAMIAVLNDLTPQDLLN